MTDLLVAVPLVLLTLAAGYGLAHPLFASVGLRPTVRGDVVWPLNLGWALLGYLVLALGLAGQLRSGIVFTVLALLAAPGAWWLWRAWRLPGEVSAATRPTGYRLGMLVLVALLALGLIEVLAPPTTFDTLTYHFPIPVDYVRDAGIRYHPYFPYNAPHLIETLTVIPFLAHSETGAQLLYLSLAVLFIFALWQWTATATNRATALLATLIIGSTPMFTYIKVNGHVEAGLAGVTVLGLWAVWKALAESATPARERAWLLVGGAFIGAACGIKYYGLFTALAVGLMIVLDALAQRAPALALRRGAWFSVAVALFGLPFYLKNGWFTGNPLYPEMYGLFGGRDWSEALKAATADGFADKRQGGTGLWDLIVSPWALTLEGGRFSAGRTGFGALFLALLPLLFLPLAARERRGGWVERFRPAASLTAWLSSYALIFWVLWFELAFQRGRHLFPVFALLAMLLAMQIRTIWTGPAWRGPWRAATGIALGVAFSVQLGVAALYYREFAKVAVGAQTRTGYLTENRAFWPDMAWANAHLPPDAQVLNLVGNYQYYLDRAQFYPSPYFQGRIDWTEIRDVDALYTRLRELGFTHVVEIDTDAVIPTPLRARMHALTRELRLRYGEVLHQAVRRERASRTADTRIAPVTLYVFRLRDTPN